MTVDGELLALAETLGSSLREASPMPWGDAGATWRLRLADGRDMMGRRFAAGPANLAERVAATMRVAALAALPVPDVRRLELDGTPWLITRHIEGAVGAMWLDTPVRARTLAAAMGSLRRQLLEIDHPTDTDMATSADDPSPIGAAAKDAIGAAESTLSERRAEAVFVHGDFAPINVIVDGDGGVLALLDFEHAHLGDPLEDAAWWSWVVRHHHPDAWHAGWPTFCEAAAIDPVEDGPTIHALMLRALARRAGAAQDVQARDRWVARLNEAAAWQR